MATMSADQRLKDLGLELPPAPKPVGVYKPIQVIGNLAYLSGHGPLRVDGTMVTGRLGLDLDVDCGYAAARLTGLALLSTLQSHFGSLDKVKRLVKLLGLVRGTDGFADQPAVINGCSELFRDVFGEENGIAARSALGTNALPGGIAVEIEAIFEVA
jgi:enamine deaminase RidA (YjgF/YER057c/UK114 family)